jgi:hypothetical protein
VEAQPLDLDPGVSGWPHPRTETRDRDVRAERALLGRVHACRREPLGDPRLEVLQALFLQLDGEDAGAAWWEQEDVCERECRRGCAGLGGDDRGDLGDV